MSEYDNTNRGVLFRNTRKEKETHPDHNGTIDVEGVEYWLSAWIKESKEGKKFFSLSIKKKEPKPQSAQPQPMNEEELNDQIPF